METILVRSENGSDENVYLKVAKETGVDVDRMKKDIASGRAKDLYLEDKKAMNVSFLTLRYVNKLTGRSKDVENKFAASEHMNTVEELTGEKLAKKTPIDILDYFERHRGNLIGPKEIAEVFSTSVEDAERRLDLLAKDRLLTRKEFGFGGSYWTLAGTIKIDLTLEQVKLSHVTEPSQVSSEADLTLIVTKAVKNLYTQVAKEPHKTYHFPLGRAALLLVGYPREEIDKLPESAIESFAGVGYPHATNSIRPGDAVLDIGSGSGTDVLIASLRTGPQGRVMGLDITDAMMEKARANIDKMDAKNVKIIKGDATEIPLDDGSVDVATSNGVLNLVHDKKKAFREIYRVLKPGGRLQLSDIVVQDDVQKVCGLVPQLWADCIGGAAVEGEYLATIRDD
jgi:SAM-dependent methyltransferase